MDNLDIKIIRYLQEDARRTNANIARHVKKSESTVKIHVDNLINTGVIKIKAVLNPSMLGYYANLDLKVKCKPGWSEKVAAQFLQYKEVIYLGHVTGEYDVLVEVLLPSNNESYAFLTNVMKNITGIESVCSEYLLKTAKIHYEWKLPAHFSSKDDLKSNSDKIQMHSKIAKLNIQNHSSAPTLDKLDRNIVNLLQESGRRTNAEIGRILSKNETTIKNRINRMIKNGFFNIVAILDPRAVGYQINIIAYIKANQGSINSISKKLLELNELVYLALSLGRYDIQMEVLLKNRTEALHFFTETISKIPGIADMQRYTVLRVERIPYDWKLPEI